jgi:hypothetical protein
MQRQNLKIAFVWPEAPDREQIRGFLRSLPITVSRIGWPAIEIRVPASQPSSTGVSSHVNKNLVCVCVCVCRNPLRPLNFRRTIISGYFAFVAKVVDGQLTFSGDKGEICHSAILVFTTDPLDNREESGGDVRQYTGICS